MAKQRSSALAAIPGSRGAAPEPYPVPSPEPRHSHPIPRPYQLGPASAFTPKSCQRFTGAALDTEPGCFGAGKGCNVVYYNMSRVLAF